MSRVIAETNSNTPMAASSAAMRTNTTVLQMFFCMSKIRSFQN